MKSRVSTSNANRTVHQLFVIGILIVLPVTMVGFNGAVAVRSLFAPGSGRATVASGALGDGSTAPNYENVKHDLQFGVYDPDGVFVGEPDLTIRHLYVSWVAFDAEELATRLKILTQEGFLPLITIEPWPAKNKNPQRLLFDITEGRYDRYIDRLVSVLRELDGPVYLSWGHEMDQDLTERYPWSGADPDRYIAAYRYVVDRVRRQTSSQLFWVWSGVMKQGSLRYWPGNDYADFVGMPVYSFPDWDRKNYGYIRDFCATFEEKRKTVQELQKPLIITELGVCGSADFESFWMHQAFIALDHYPDVKAVVFFYARDAKGIWGSDVSVPDWRVHPDTIRSLVAWKLK